MKKTLLILLALLLACAALPAAAETVTAMATQPYMEAYAAYACCARLLDYSPETTSIELVLITPEVFRRDDILALTPGDSIYTGGKEVLIETVTEEAGYIVLNMGDYEFSEGSVWLMENSDGDFMPVEYEDYVWLEMDRMEVPVEDDLLFLDRINPASGDPLSVPTVHSAAEFLEMQANPDDPGFKANNVYVVFDADANLAVIERYYVPWQ